MNFIKSELKNIIIFSVVIIGLFAVYYFFFRGEASEEILVSTTNSAGSDAGVAELLAALSDLKTLKLDGSLFEDKVFQSLKDFHVDIPSEPKGRDNPFAPLSGGFQSEPTTVRVKTFRTQ